MPLFLQHRDTEASELMDDPDCDHDALLNTYRQFQVINTLISRWKIIYKKHIRPDAGGMEQPYSLLDIGFGGGDIPKKIAEWAQKDGIKLNITGIETDERAYEFVQDGNFPASINFRLASSTELVKEGRRFDFVISNHLIHHLTGDNFYKVLEEARQLSKQKVLFTDIKRSDIGYMVFNVLSRPVFRSSFITNDGLTSIKRSYTYYELRQRAPGGWEVTRIFPYRLLLSYCHV